MQRKEKETRNCTTVSSKKLATNRNFSAVYEKKNLLKKCEKNPKAKVMIKVLKLSSKQI